MRGQTGTGHQRRPGLQQPAGRPGHRPGPWRRPRRLPFGLGIKGGLGIGEGLENRLPVLEGLLGRIKGLGQLITGLVPVRHLAVGISEGPVRIADSVGELLMGLGGIHGEHFGLEGPDLRLHPRGLRGQVSGRLLQLPGGRIPRQAGLHIGLPAGCGFDGLRALGHGLDGPGVADLLLFGGRGGLRLVGVQV